MKQIGYVVAGTTFTVGLAGFVGYEHLQTAAVAVAKDAFNRELSAQVTELLKQRKVDGTVATEVRKYAQGDLRTQLRSEIGKGLFTKRS